MKQNYSNDKIVLYTEVTTKCTHRCKYCCIDNVHDRGDISDEVRDRVAGFLRTNNQYSFITYLHLVGEPLLYPDLDTYISMLQLSNVELWVCTNGILLNNERLTKLRDAGLKNLWYSWFYSSPNQYREYTGTSQYEKAKANLYNLIDKNNWFENIRIITFSDNDAQLQKQVAGKSNIKLEMSRNVKEWDKDNTSPKAFICIASTGLITFDWKDYNFEYSPGNIMNINDENILNEYFEATQHHQGVK